MVLVCQVCDIDGGGCFVDIVFWVIKCDGFYFVMVFDIVKW